MLLGFLISLLVIGILCGVAFWLVDFLKVPMPWSRIIQVLIVVIFLVWLLYQLPGVPGFVHAR